MHSWIEEAKAKGLSDAQGRKLLQQIEKKAKNKFDHESVNEETVRNFLEPFTSAMQDVSTELTAAGFTVNDLGYDFRYVTSRPEQFALIREMIAHTVSKEKIHFVYGRNWDIITPEGSQMDRIHLVPLTSNITHFDKGAFITLSGWGSGTSPEELRNILGRCIASFYSSD